MPDFFKQPMMEIPYESRGDFPLTGLGVKGRRLRVVEHLGRLGDRFTVGWLVGWLVVGCLIQGGGQNNHCKVLAYDLQLF